MLARAEGLFRERLHVVLLRDVYGVWLVADATESRPPTNDMLAALHTHAPDQWGHPQPAGRTALTSQRMGRMLVDNFSIHD